jgi:serine/threonine protein phosphatase PrpC
MGGVKRISPEGGSGGKRGHSGMTHWAKTAEIKAAARKARRIKDADSVREELVESPASTKLSIAVRVHGSVGPGQDHAGAFDLDGGLVLVVADGAGGTSGGAEAAQSVIDAVGELEASDTNWVSFLGKLDGQLSADASVGETTAVIAFIRDGYVHGASVGDSEAWLVDEGQVADLTENQRRKPLLGSGLAKPVAFGPVAFAGVLVLGSDGLFKYVDPGKIRRLSAIVPVTEAADALLQAARLPSGSFQDDISVIVMTA